MLYPKEVGEHCSLLNLASNAVLCIWSSSACRRGDGRRVYLCTSRGSCFKLHICPENNVFLFLLFFPSSGIGSHCREHSVLPGCQIFVCCWAGVQGVVPGDVGWDAVEEAHWENGQDRLLVEGFVREERMVRKWNLHLFCPHSGTKGVVCFKPYLKSVIQDWSIMLVPNLTVAYTKNQGSGSEGIISLCGNVKDFFFNFLIWSCSYPTVTSEIYRLRFLHPACLSVQIKKLCVPQGNPKLVSSSEQKSFFRSGNGGACAMN